mgnify:CR=1 FL=1
MCNHFKSISQFSGGFTAPRIHRVQPDRHGTSGNVFAGIPICVCGISAGSTSEQETVPIGFINMSALMTHSGSVPGRYHFNSNSFGLGFISNKKSEHPIRPAVNSASKGLSFAVRGFSNVRQILKDNFPCINRISPLYKSFRSNMHGMFSYGCLMSRHSLEKLSGRTGSNRLYFGSGFSDIEKFLIQMICFVKKFIVIGVRGYKKAFKSLIDPDQDSGSFRFRDIDFIRKIKVPLITFKRDLGVLPMFGNKARIIKSNWISPESDAFFRSSEIPFPNYWNRRFFKFSKAPFFMPGFLGFIGGGNSSEKGASELRRKVEFLSNCFVIRCSKPIGIGIFLFKDYLRNPINSFKPIWKDFIGFVDSVKFKFDRSYCFHIFKYSIF